MLIGWTDLAAILVIIAWWGIWDIVRTRTQFEEQLKLIEFSREKGGKK